MVSVLLTLLILCLIFGLIYYVVTLIPLPQPFKNIAIVCVLVIFLIVLIEMLLPLAGGHLALFRN